jgi:hypothetical protein
LHSNSRFKTTVLRFEVWLVKIEIQLNLLGRENMDNPDAPINLIHQADCIGIILK